MKKLILITMVMFFTLIQAKAQQLKQFIVSDNPATFAITPLPGDKLSKKNMYSPGDGGQAKDYAYYNRTSRTLRITGLSLLGAGLVLGGAGLIVATNQQTYSYESEL